MMEEPEIENLNKQRTMMKSTSFEEVISYRNKFMSYWAVPLFMLVIIALGLLGWFVRVPEYLVVSREGFKVIEVQEGYAIQIKSETTAGKSLIPNKAVLLRYKQADGILEIEASPILDKQIILREEDLPAATNFRNALIEIRLPTYGDRFMRRLLLDLRKNMKLKTPE